MWTRTPARAAIHCKATTRARTPSTRTASPRSRIDPACTRRWRVTWTGCPTDHRILASWLEAERGVTVRMTNGFDGLRAELPPPTRRAVVLMDPSYELERDYTLVVNTLREAVTRFAQGTYVVWYPQVGRVVAQELPKRLQALAPGGWLNARLTVQPPDAQGFGLVGSGVFVINPPHTLHADLQAALPGVHAALNRFEGGSWRLDQRPA